MAPKRRKGKLDVSSTVVVVLVSVYCEDAHLKRKRGRGGRGGDFVSKYDARCLRTKKNPEK